MKDPEGLHSNKCEHHHPSYRVQLELPTLCALQARSQPMRTLMFMDSRVRVYSVNMHISRVKERDAQPPGAPPQSLKSTVLCYTQITTVH